MPLLDWPQASTAGGGLADLVAKKKWGRAIEMLRKQLLEGQVPSVQGRLQLVDLLVLDGRGREAVPILFGLADEFSQERFLARAVAILKRVERIEPGRKEVSDRLARLAEEQTRLAQAAAAQPLALEAQAAAAETQQGGPAASVDLEPEPEPAAPTPEPFSSESAEIEGGPAEAASIPSADSDAAEDSGVGDRLRGVFRRFLSMLPGGADVAPAREPAPSDDVEGDDLEEVEALGAADVEPPVEPVEPPAVAAEAVEEASRVETAEQAPTTPEPSEEPPAATPAAWSQIPLEVSIAGPDQAGIADVSVASAESEIQAQESAPVEAEEIEEEIGPEEVGIAGLPRDLSSRRPDETLPPTSAESAEVPAPPSATDAVPVPVEEPLEVSAGGEAGPDALSDEVFHQQLLDLVEETLRRPSPAGKPVEAPRRDAELASRLVAAPLFGGLSAEELLAVVRGLELRTFAPGEALVSEGERGHSLFIITSGRAKVFVRSLDGHAVEVARLEEGDFFGEIAALSGGRRAATVTAAAACEVLELDKATLEQIALIHPRVRETIEATYIQRASSPDAAAARCVDLTARRAPQKALEVLESHFGAGRWDPRMRLRLADVLIKAGKLDEAVPVLVSLAEDLAHHGYPAKAIALIKKVEQIQRRDVEEIALAPLPRAIAGDPVLDDEQRWPGGSGERGAAFEQWLLRLTREAVDRRHAAVAEATATPAPQGYVPGLRASPLFEDFAEDELLALIQGLRLLTFQTGDIIISEGEPGQSIFVLATGGVRVMVSTPDGRNVSVCSLDEGAFFGEISTLSGRPRSATVVAASPCEMLELDKATLEGIGARHPRVREVIERAYVERAGDPAAERIRTSAGEQRLSP
jgi:CRP-like cAMP-binding protein